jgi:hypothetical protein
MPLKNKKAAVEECERVFIKSPEQNECKGSIENRGCPDVLRKIF